MRRSYARAHLSAFRCTACRARVRGQRQRGAPARGDRCARGGGGRGPARRPLRPHHHRSVLTLVGGRHPRAVDTAAVEPLDLGGHDGVHPRIGVVDVVPFVPSATHDHGRGDRRPGPTSPTWAADELEVPCFLYGPERSLPDLRRERLPSARTRPWPGPAAPDRRSHRGRCPPGAGRLQPLAGRAGPGARPDGSPPGCAARRSVRSGWPWATVCRCRCNLDRPGSCRSGRRSMTGWPPRRGSTGPSWWASLPRRRPGARSTADRWAALDLGEERTIEARLEFLASGSTSRPVDSPDSPRIRPGPRPAGRRAGGGCGDAPARSCRPRCRTSRCW